MIEINNDVYGPTTDIAETLVVRENIIIRPRTPCFLTEIKCSIHMLSCVNHPDTLDGHRRQYKLGTHAKSSQKAPVIPPTTPHLGGVKGGMGGGVGIKQGSWHTRKARRRRRTKEANDETDCAT